MAAPLIDKEMEMEALARYNAAFNSNIKSLKEKQREAIECIVKRRDAICMLPTGYGKSLVYEILPMFCSESQVAIIILEPLNVIIDQQLTKLGASSFCIKSNISDEDLCKIGQGQFTYIFSHPENIIGNKAVYKALQTYQQRTFIVVDEAHCVLDWGLEFRPIFREIKQLRAVLPSASVIALSATLSLAGQNSVSKHLLMRNPEIIATEPVKSNLVLTVNRRPSEVKKSYDYVFEPVFFGLKEKRQSYPLTLIYCIGNMDWVGYGIEMAKRILGEDFYDGHKCSENARVAMFHSSLETGDQLKNIIYSNLARETSPLRVVIATVALGMGVDLRHVTQVIHAGPPKNIEDYIQQIGRGGRGGSWCYTKLYFNSSDLGRPAISKDVREYCRNEDKCRRVLLNSYFGYTSLPNADNCTCCDVCGADLISVMTLSVTQLQLTSDVNRTALRAALTSYTRLAHLGHLLNSQAIEHIVRNPVLYLNVSNCMKDFNLPEEVSKVLSTIVHQVVENK